MLGMRLARQTALTFSCLNQSIAFFRHWTHGQRKRFLQPLSIRNAFSFYFWRRFWLLGTLLDGLCSLSTGIDNGFDTVSANHVTAEF